MHWVAVLRCWAWPDIKVAGSFFPILSYLARRCCVQHAVNWAISAVTQISEQNATKIIKLSFKVARLALHTKDITQVCQHHSCRPTYHMCCCVTNVTSQTKTLAVAQLIEIFPAFPWTRGNVFTGNRRCFFTEPAEQSTLSSAVSIRTFRIISSHLNSGFAVFFLWACAFRVS